MGNYWHEADLRLGFFRFFIMESRNSQATYISFKKGKKRIPAPERHTEFNDGFLINISFYFSVKN